MALTLQKTDGELPEQPGSPTMPKIKLSGEAGSDSSLATTHDSGMESDGGPRAYINPKLKEVPESARDIRRKRLEALSASVRKTRRVLTPRSDNPLLRPLGWKGDTPTKLPAATTKARPKRNIRVVEKSKDGFSDSEKGVGESDAEEASDDNETEGMSDFIVDDSDSLEEDESDREMTPPPPRSVRKLVKGRKVDKEPDEDRSGLELKMGALDLTDRDTKKSPMDSSVNYSRSFQEGESEVLQAVEDYEKSKVPARGREESKAAESGAVPDADEFTTRSKTSENEDEKEENRFMTPPSSPKGKPRTLTSPRKIQHIPMTPHRPSMDSFWSQEVVNDWNDEYSPRKAPKPQLKSLVSLDQSSSDISLSPAKAKTTQARENRAAKKAWAAEKIKLAQDFLLELDEVLAKGEISLRSESTGGVKIIWSPRLNSTAGQAKWKRVPIKSKDGLPSKDGSATPTYDHYATIELAEKVVVDKERLLNTMAHEFCHLCTMMIDGVSDRPHGTEFKRWAAACSSLFKSRGVKVTTKHSYDIAYKFAWECTMCGIEYQRHSKSIDIAKQRCGACKATLVQTRPAPRSAAASKPTSYQVFVKENMKKVREENPGSPQKDIMRLLGQRYQEHKASEKPSPEPEAGSEVDVVAVDEEDESNNSTPDVVTPASIRKKLDFINLSDD